MTKIFRHHNMVDLAYNTAPPRSCKISTLGKQAERSCSDKSPSLLLSLARPIKQQKYSTRCLYLYCMPPYPKFKAHLDFTWISVSAQFDQKITTNFLFSCSDT